MTPLTVAEFGQSNRGDLRIAIKQAETAANAGADYVKFQCFDPADLASPRARRYWNPDLGGSESQLDTFEANGMLESEEWHTLAEMCATFGVRFLATPFSLDAVDLLEEVGVQEYKVASADIVTLPLLERIAATGKRVFLSTGAAERDEVEWALQVLSPCPVTLLACTLSYPCKPQDANLGRITSLYEHFGDEVEGVGYSDHTLGTSTALAAAALGATVLEKHATLWPGGPVPDDSMALDPDELRDYVTMAHAGARLRGSTVVAPSEAEQAARVEARRSVCAAKPISQGETLTEDMLCALRPGDGISPMQWREVIGTEATRSYESGEAIHP